MTETPQAEAWVSMVVPDNPDAKTVAANVIQKMIRKPFQIAASQAAGIEMEKSGMGTGLLNSNFELREKKSSASWVETASYFPKIPFRSVWMRL